MNDAIESTVDFFIVLTLITFDAFITLLSGIRLGVLKEQKALPIKKSTAQLNKMLKRELIDLVLVYQD
ncbi:MAG: hypothetical protein CMP45_05470 [Rickettsiales bacterium]|nr:hypothetical protein [Rickettsiales bacterium]|tara:strand:- start:203 stop:406 length:204 start_codon:yes stop_codon:yes gene_type:complete